MFCHKLIRYEWMWCTWIKQYCSEYRVDGKHTQYHAGVILSLLHWYMIHPATHRVLLASLARSLWRTSLRRWLPRPVTIVPLRSLHRSLRTIVGIVSQLSTLETSIGLNRGSVPDRCPRAIVGATRLRSRSSRCLRVEALWLKQVLQLQVLWIPSTLSTRTVLRRTLLRVEARMSVTAWLSMWLELVSLLAQFLPLAFQSNCLVHLCLEI
jgi:hypothetical protein